MYCHYPKEIPDVEAYYNVIQGQTGTWQDPQYDPEIEWVELEINGRPVSIELYEHLLNEFGDAWELEIINKIKARV